MMTVGLIDRRLMVYFFIIILVCEAIGTAATPGILCQQMECRWPGETEVLGENLPQRHFSPT
jgi:hypothetical protein